MVGQIYRITNTVTGSFYIGGSCRLNRRLGTHFTQLKHGKHHSFLFQSEYDTHGKDAFVVDILEQCDPSEITSREQHHLDTMKPNLNISRLAGCGDLISYHPNRDAIVEKMTASLADRFASMTAEERREKYGKPGEANGMFGRTHSEAARAAVSKANRGRAGRAGHKWTESQRILFVEKAKQRTGEKNPFFGRTHSDETKRKLAQTNKGKTPKNARKVSIDGIIYGSGTAAAKALDVSPALVIYRIKHSPKFGDYQYVD